MKMISKIGLSAVALALLAGTGCGIIEEGNNGFSRTYSGTIDDNQTWSGTSVVEGSLSIRGQVTVEECSTIEIGPGVRIDVEDGGAIVVEGTEDCPVTITSSQPSPGAGDWQRFDIFDSSSNNNSFTHTIIEYGGSGAQYGMMWVDSGANVSFDHVTFRHSADRGAHFVSGANIDRFSNVTFEDIEDDALILGANELGSLEPVTVNGEVPPIVARNATIDDDATWGPLGIPVVVDGFTLTAALQIEPGTEVRVGPGARLDVEDGGTIQANGTSEAPVVFTSSKSSPGAGDWQRFDIFSSAGNANSFTYTTIEYAGSSDSYGAMWVDANANVTLDNVTFSNNGACDIADNGTVDVTATDYVSCL